MFSCYVINYKHKKTGIVLELTSNSLLMEIVLRGLIGDRYFLIKKTIGSKIIMGSFAR
jgi:hypothetical protein